MGREVSPNDLFRAARERLPSPSGAPRPISRQELADAVNLYLYRQHGVKEKLDQDDIGRIERGRTRWPGKWRRVGLRAVLGAASDAELGLYFCRTIRPLDDDQAAGQRTVEHWISADQLLASPPRDTRAPARPTMILEDGGVDATNRRQVLTDALGLPATLALSGVLEAALPQQAAPDGLAQVTALLTGGGDSSSSARDVDEAAITRAAVQAKQDYQAGRYKRVLHTLPDLLASVQHTPSQTRWHAVASDVYQTTCSVLLKLDEPGLALLAADRSTAAAHRSGDPVVVGASTRAVAHALASNGHPGRAVTLAIAGARELERATGLSITAALAVYGALLLRAASLAARSEDRATTAVLLNEAQHTAERIDGSDNARWTYFCADNVTLHRVNIAVSLGDAGQAVEHARRIDPARIRLGERRACFYLDLTRAFTQWGKYDQAYEALRAAEHAAPQEITARPTGRALVADLRHRCPPRLQQSLRHLTDHPRART